jgi:hypothetical protein
MTAPDALSLALAAAKTGRDQVPDRRALLAIQAKALDAMFFELALRASALMDSNLAAAERYMRLALRAQAQCRVTLMALQATIESATNELLDVADSQGLAEGPAPAGINREFPTNELLDVAESRGLAEGAARTGKNREFATNELLDVAEFRHPAAVPPAPIPSALQMSLAKFGSATGPPGRHFAHRTRAGPISASAALSGPGR